MYPNNSGLLNINHSLLHALYIWEVKFLGFREGIKRRGCLERIESGFKIWKRKWSNNEIEKRNKTNLNLSQVKSFNIWWKYLHSSATVIIKSYLNKVSSVDFVQTNQCPFSTFFNCSWRNVTASKAFFVCM